MILKSFSANGRNLMKKVGNVIDWSKREESLHGDAGIYIFKKIKEEYPEIWTNEFKSSIYVAFTTAMMIEEKLIKDIFNYAALPNLTSDQVINYMKNRANDSLKRLGLKHIFDIDEVVLAETVWFDMESKATQFTDFLAGGRVTDYVTKNDIVFDENSVKVGDDFNNTLEERFTKNRLS
jgi:ribonucleoside-diphosphate reductase beta chain